MKTPRAPAPLGVHCWTDVAWWDQVRGVFNEASLLPHPSLPRPPPPLLGLSSELHVARLPTASCDKPSCPLTTSFLMLAGRTRAATASVYVHARGTRTNAHMLTHWVQREHHPRRGRVSKWPNTGCLMSVCFASSLLSLRLYLRSPSLFLFIFPFVPFFVLCIDIYISFHLGSCFPLCPKGI